MQMQKMAGNKEIAKKHKYNSQMNFQKVQIHLLNEGVLFFS
jgi:hypothetical protein